MKYIYRLFLVILSVSTLAGCGTGVRPSDPYAGQDFDALATGTAYVRAKATAQAESTGRAEWIATSEAATYAADSTAAMGMATREALALEGTKAAYEATGTAIRLEAIAEARRATETAESEALALASTATRIADDAERATIALRMEKQSEWINTLGKWALAVAGVVLVALLLFALYRAIEAVQFRAHIVKPDENGVQPVNYLQKSPHAVHDPDQLNRLVRGGYGAAGRTSTETPQDAPGAPPMYDVSQIRTIAPETAPSALPERVTLRALLNGERPRLNRLVLGISQEGPVYGDLEKLIHILVGGSTRFGKSNFLRALAYQLAVSPEQPELVIADIEAVTFGAFANCGRLRYPLATEPDEIARVFEDLNGELTRRRDMFARFPTVDTLSSYNALQFEEAPLPPVVVMVDEITALLKHSDVGPALEMLALRGGKFGLWVCASGQDLKTSTIDSATRNQFATRLQFGAMSSSQSRVLVGTPDAANIRTPGRAIAWLPGRGDVELQTPYVTAREIMTAFANGMGGGPLHELPSTSSTTAPNPVIHTPPPPTDPIDRVADELGIDTDDVRRVIELRKGGESLSGTARQVFGTGSGDHFYRVKAILSAYEAYDNDDEGTKEGKKDAAAA